MQDLSAAASNARTATLPAAISRHLQLGTAFLLGVVILFGAAFLQTSAVHSAAHDMRHSQGFPCH